MADVMTFISSDFPVVFLLGFSAGFIVCATIYMIRAAVKLFIRIVRGRA